MSDGELPGMTVARWTAPSACTSSSRSPFTTRHHGKAQYAWLARRGSVNAVETKDADALLHGATALVNNLALKQKVAEWLALKDELAH